VCRIRPTFQCYNCFNFLSSNTLFEAVTLFNLDNSKKVDWDCLATLYI